MVTIIEHIQYKSIKIIFMKIGDKSLLMWFVHCAFFGVTKVVFQPILYAPKWPVLVLLWGLLICYIVSRGIDCVVKRILSK